LAGAFFADDPVDFFAVFFAAFFFAIYVSLLPETLRPGALSYCFCTYVATTTQ